MRPRTICGNCESVRCHVKSALLSNVPASYHGGWLAPNIYFLGYAGCVQVNGIRIAGASGIFKQHDYNRGERSSGWPDSLG
jgi:hypothetical protein